MAYETLGRLDQDFMTVDEAKRHYQLHETASLFASECHKELEAKGITSIEIPLQDAQFEELVAGFDLCIEECPELLESTFYEVDKRFGNDAGYVRKNAKILNGTQYQDPKSYMHFNELSRIRWSEQFAHSPRIIREFLESGYEVHDALIRVARTSFQELEETHPNISLAYFPGKRSHTFMRILSYDGYPVDEAHSADVAKAHYDIGGATIQAYADAPGFWGADGPNGTRIPYDTGNGQGYLFMGKGHEKLYGKQAQLSPLYHGVERIIPAGLIHIPRRHSVVMFIDAPNVDYRVQSQDTQPEVYSQPQSQERIA